MSETDPTERDGVSRLSRRGLLALGATLAGTTGISMFSENAAAHELMAFRDAFIGKDEDRQGLGSKGWLFFAKDTGTVYYHNGSSWVDLGIGGGDSPLSDTDSDGLLEASNYDGIDVGQVKADSVSTGQATLGNVSVSASNYTVADDSVQEVSLGGGNQQIHIYAINSGSAAFISNYGNLSTMALGMNATNQGSTDLTGTTGPDNSFNYSRVGNTLHLENRWGSERSFEVVFYDY